MAKLNSIQHNALSNYVRPLLVMIACAFLVYANGIKGGFVFDDASVVAKRPELHSLLNIPKLFVSPYEQNAPYAGLYRPLTMASFAINEFLFGNQPWGFHVVNILLAAINATLVFWLLYFLLNDRKVAYLGGLVFLVHPLHVEAVTSIVGRGELLMTLFALLSFVAFVYRRYWLMGLLFLCALLSKETAIAILGIYGVYDWYTQAQSLKGIRTRYAPVLLALLVYLGMRAITLGHFMFHPSVQYVENPLYTASYGMRLVNALKVFLLYLGKIVWPYHLSADYSFNSISFVSWYSWQPWLALFLLVGGLYLLISKRISYATALGIAFFIFPYLIISNIVLPVGTMMAERLMYLPLLGICILLAGGMSYIVTNYPRMRIPLTSVVVLIILVCAVRTYVRNADWYDNHALFASAGETSPNSVLVRTNLAVLALKDGKWDEGKRELAIAQSIYSDYAPELNLLGVVAAHDGDLNNAELYFKKAIAVNPYHLDAYRNLIQLYTIRKQYELAKEYSEKAHAINPAFI